MIRLTDLAGKGSFTMGGKKFEYGKVYSNPYATAFKAVNEAEESEDHEVSMAQNQLDSIIKSATELKQKMGEEEKQIPAWIQDHITNSENYISQAASNYHEYGDSNEEVNEAPAQTKGEKIQRYNDRVKKLRDKITSTKNSEQKMKYQTTLKGILQRLSDIRKDHGIKAPHREGVVNEGKFEPNFAKKIEALIKRELGVSEFQAIGPRTGRVMNRQDYYFHIPNHTHGIVVSKKQFGGQYPDTYYVALTNWQGRPKEETEVNHIKDENVVLKTVSAIAKKYKKQLTYAGMKETKSVNEAAMNPVKKVVNAILKKHKVDAMKTTSTSVRGFHNIKNGGYKYDGDYFLQFYKVPQNTIEKIAAEMKKAGVKGVQVNMGNISADYTKTGLTHSQFESVNEAGPCWKGYKQVGMKDKGGKQVPNCVPESVIREARSVGQIQKDFSKVVAAIASELEKYKSVKGTDKAKQYIANLKKLGAAKEKLESEMDYVVSNIYADAELEEGCGCK